MSYYLDKCPICDGRIVGSCRCPRSDSQCENGHQWHYCLAHGEPKLVWGPSDHSKDIMECTCLPSKSVGCTGE